MTKERKRETEIIPLNKSKQYGIELSQASLASLDDSPSFQILASQEINSAVNEGLKIRELLETINNMFFQGKGKIEPFSQYSELTIHTPKEEAAEREESKAYLRFKKLFSSKHEVLKTQANLRLWIEDEEILKNIKRGERPDAIDIEVYHDVHIQNKTLHLNVASFLYFDIRGSLDVKKIHLRRMSHGRDMRFSLDSLPSGKDMATQLLQSTKEILEELEAQGFISLELEEENEKDSQD